METETPIASAVFKGLAERERTKAALDALVKAKDAEELKAAIERLENGLLRTTT